MSIQHAKTKNWIKIHLDGFGKTLIAACGPQMGIDERFCKRNCKRRDAVIFRPEQNVRYRHTDPDRFGEEKTMHFQNDAVVYVRPGQWGLNDVPSKLKTFTVGIEIKEKLSDLDGDTKCMFYLGWTDFYFFLVTNDLKEAAMEKLRTLNDARIGLMTNDKNGFKVWVVSQRQQVLPQNQYALALQAMFSECTGNAECVIDWDGYAPEDAVDVDAYRNAARGIHPEYAGREDSFVNLFNAGVCDSHGSNATIGKAEANHNNDERKLRSAERKAAKDARERELANDLKDVDNEEIRHRLVAQSNDAQSVYHAIRKAAEITAENTVAVTAESVAEQVGVSKSTVETSLRSLRNAGLIESVGARKTPSIHVVGNLESNGYANCLLFNSVKSPSEKRRMSLVCQECSHKDCPAHQ